jgi:aspartyl-tRNA(Asn)/glutamyl-tRNA(Gln) amidotransferase subunit C
MDRDELKRIADIARIRLSEDEVSRFSIELEKLLSHYKKIEEIDTSAIQDFAYMHNLENELREDDINEASDEIKERIIKEFTKESERLLLAPKSLK